MNEDRFAGTARNLGGKAQEGVGRFTGNTKMEAEGVINQAAVIDGGADFGLELVFRDETLGMMEVARGFFDAAAKIVEMLWFAGDFEMAAAREVAGDIFLAD